ncbi:MAG: TrbC/VIRB2 family protein [Pelotomaculum sp. PtaB.Bin104]|nr:MAG: TrbC/VIRB2 family protein [Pelotomaculum sp. PtaB.Bin104]
MLKRAINLAVVVVVLSAASNVLASGSGMPWETPLSQILNSITGPVAKALGAIAIAATGLALAFGEGGHGFRKILQIAFGLSIAFTATSFGIGFFGFGGGAGF